MSNFDLEMLSYICRETWIHVYKMAGTLQSFVGDPSDPPYNFSQRNPLGQIWTNGIFTFDGLM